MLIRNLNTSKSCPPWAMKNVLIYRRAKHSIIFTHNFQLYQKIFLQFPAIKVLCKSVNSRALLDYFCVILDNAVFLIQRLITNFALTKRHTLGNFLMSA